MENMIKITEQESTYIFGGGENFTEYVCHAIGSSIAVYMKLALVIFREGPKCIGDLGVHGDMTVWK